MQRSPPYKRYDFDSDLLNISTRKRKHEQEDIAESFQTFTDLILNKMDSWKTELDKKKHKLTTH